MTDEIREIAQATMLGDLMHVVLDCVKALPKPWPQLGQIDQDEWLQSIEKQCKSAIEQATTIIASGNHVTMRATLKSVTFKDGVQASLTVDKHSQHRIDLADAAGKTVRLVILDTDETTSDRNKPKADADQRALTFEEHGTTNAEGEDVLLNLAITFVRTSRKCTISAVQRHFKIGYNRAARLIEKLGELKVLSPMDESGKRVVLTEQQ